MTKNPNDFTKKILVDNGYTKKVLKKMAEAYEKIAKTASDTGKYNPSAPGRAKQLRELLKKFFNEGK